MNIPLTLWPGLTAVDSPRSVVMPWSEIVKLFSEHREAPTKNTVPGFGPYECLPPPGPCYHKRGPVKDAHRCDACVEEMSMAVFDVDIGTWAQVQACEDWLHDARLHRIWYSSFSFDPKAKVPSLRLILPLARPVSGKVWASFRERTIRKFGIPADPKKCGGRSHFYYLPSGPPGADVLFASGGERFLDPDDIGAVPDLRMTPREAAELLIDWEPEEGEEGLIDLGPMRATLLEEAKSANRRASLQAKSRGELLRALAEGKALAQRGDRDNATTRAAMIAATMFPDATLRDLELLFRDSLVAMQNEGSSQNAASVRRKLISAMRKRAENDLIEREFLERMDELRGEIPKVDWNPQ